VPNTSPDQVVAFYQQKLNEFSNNSGERCVRTPASGDQIVDPDIPNSVPYKYDCMFDRSGVNTTQFTQVTIFPGSRSSDPFYNSEGMTVIHYQQEWQP
jgi:hypothetical protein